MRHDSDFADYLAARWHPVVCMLVERGASQTQAEAVARTAFARCYRRWGRLRRSPDLEAEVHEAVLDCWGGRGGADPLALGSRQVPDPIDVPPPTLGAVQGEAREQRLRTARRVAVSVTVLAVGAGLATWVATRPEGPAEPAAPEVARVENVADVSWWANGLLHLPHVTVALGRLDGLVEIGDGAVVGDQRGGVSYVAADGRVTDLGRKEPGAALVGSDERGWAAWVDPGGDTSQVVVHDLRAGRVLATYPLAPGASGGLEDGAQPIAMDGDALYFTTAAGVWEWRLPDGDPEIVDPEIVAARGIGPDLQVSASGTYVLTRLPASGGRDASVRIQDLRSGQPVWTGLRRGDAVVAATLGPSDEVTYVVARKDDAPAAGEFLRQSFSGPYALRTCHLVERTCSTVLSFSHTGAQPVLPH